MALEGGSIKLSLRQRRRQVLLTARAENRMSGVDGNACFYTAFWLQGQTGLWQERRTYPRTTDNRAFCESATRCNGLIRKRQTYVEGRRNCRARGGYL